MKEAGAMRNYVLSVMLFLFTLGSVALANGMQVKDPPKQNRQSLPSRQAGGGADGFGDNGQLLMEPIRQNWRVGVQIKAGSSSARDFLVTIPIPTNWPEQQVTLLKENIPVEIRSVKHRSLNSGVEQLVIEIPRIQANRLVELTMLYQVTTGQVRSPADTSLLTIPKKIPREAKEYMGVGPQISYRNSKLRKQVKGLISDQTSDWSKVESIFDWVRENVELVGGEPEDSLHTFREQKGCAEDLVGLFVAMCRAAKVPARVVWVEGHSYAEFMLVDERNIPRWFPCQVAGLREFGSMSEPRVILQKGDNIKVPEKDARQKYVVEFVRGSGKSKPQVRFIRDLLPADN
ncbi:MAG: transglutaminase-like domain-containing protein [Mariniblastus sp.]|nr:transglutaminase-like domain-containing protein [Mariniblastus sp.]